MPTTTLKETDSGLEARFLAAFETGAGRSLNGRAGEAVSSRRQPAIERFEALGLPTSDLEAYKYTNLARALKKGDYQIASDGDTPTVRPADVDDLLIPDLDAHLVVTINGRFSEELSALGEMPDGVAVTSFADATRTHSDVLDRHYGRYATFGEDAMVALNTAFAGDGVFVYVPEGTVLERPVFALHVTKADAPVAVQPRHLFVAEAGAGACIIERQHALSGTRAFSNTVTEVFTGREAHLDHYLIQDQGDEAVQVDTCEVYQESQSVFDTCTVTLSGEVVRNDLRITPDDDHCETHLYGLYLGRGSMHVDNHTIVEHTMPDCFSNELYKGILSEAATGVFNGRVHVHPGAQRINAYQSNKNVVLTDRANIYSKPELEIYADDVQCSHGSTTGQLDEEAVFYLRSRGISKEKARRMLLSAFAHDVIKNVRVEPLREWLEERVAGRIG